MWIAKLSSDWTNLTIDLVEVRHLQCSLPRTIRPNGDDSNSSGCVDKQKYRALLRHRIEWLTGHELMWALQYCTADWESVQGRQWQMQPSRAGRTRQFILHVETEIHFVVRHDVSLAESEINAISTAESDRAVRYAWKYNSFWLILNDHCTSDFLLILHTSQSRS